MTRHARGAVLCAVLAPYLVLSLLHPTANPGPGDDVRLWMGLHLVQLVLIGGLAAVLWLLLAGVISPLATLARALVLPFVIAYTTLDAILGLAWGYVARQATMVGPGDRPGAARLVDRLLAPSPAGYALYAGAGLCWLVAVGAAVAALSPSRPRLPLAILFIGAAVFAVGHAPPTGPLGICLMSGAILRLERPAVTGNLRS